MFISSSQALPLLQAGKVVALPTETVYGLAADATNENAVKNIYMIKGRPSFNPLISHVADMAMAEAYGVFSPLAQKIAHYFWAGPLTMIVPKRATPLNGYPPLASSVTAGLETVALRVPAHSVMQAMIKALNRPLAAPSANKSGHMTATTAEDVACSLENPDVPIVSDENACKIGVESTIIQVRDDAMIVLRKGGITIEALAAFSDNIIIDCEAKKEDENIISPGQLLKHYAPKQACLFLNQTTCPESAGYLAFGADHLPKCRFLYQLSETQDLTEASYHLFKALYEMERLGVKEIFIAPLPDIGVGKALNDRLRRAALGN